MELGLAITNYSISLGLDLEYFALSTDTILHGRVIY
jgi:hypothetical protein